MSNTSTDRTEESFFGEVISTYTRAQALEDGVLVDAGPMAKEVGFRFPVALTSAVWSDCVAWTDSDSQKMPFQDQSGRLYDLLFMAALGEDLGMSHDGRGSNNFLLLPTPEGTSMLIGTVTSLPSVEDAQSVTFPVLLHPTSTFMRPISVV